MTKKLAAPKSSPLPWRVRRFTRLDKRIVISSKTDNPEGDPMVMVDNDDTQDGPGNAALIVRRVNQGEAFDAMVEALKSIVEGAKPTGVPVDIDTAWKLRAISDQARSALKLSQEVR